MKGPDTSGCNRGCTVQTLSSEQGETDLQFFLPLFFPFLERDALRWSIMRCCLAAAARVRKSWCKSSSSESSNQRQLSSVYASASTIYLHVKATRRKKGDAKVTKNPTKAPNSEKPTTWYQHLTYPGRSLPPWVRVWRNPSHSRRGMLVPWVIRPDSEFDTT